MNVKNNVRIGVVALAVLLRIGVSASAAVSERDAVRAIVGEAAGEGVNGMRAVASVLRTRGSLKGFYGYHGKHVDKQPAWVFEQARRAWRESATKDYANGATHFESTDFKRPTWSRGMTHRSPPILQAVKFHCLYMMAQGEWQLVFAIREDAENAAEKTAAQEREYPNNLMMRRLCQNIWQILK